MKCEIASVPNTSGLPLPHLKNAERETENHGYLERKEVVGSQKCVRVVNVSSLKMGRII
jgi:hypothetical protein